MARTLSLERVSKFQLDIRLRSSVVGQFLDVTCLTRALPPGAFFFKKWVGTCKIKHLMKIFFWPITSILLSVA
ncbi:hypothetical protein Hanom_Chr09g00818521 [Helianthus anomalus]